MELVVHCIVPMSCGSSFFQIKWANISERIKKIVEKNIKKKRNSSCKCASRSQEIHDLVVLYTPLLYDRDQASFDVCVTWYISCHDIGKLNKEENNELPRIWGWPMY